jgi:hypothetical protein
LKLFIKYLFLLLLPAGALYGQTILSAPDSPVKQIVTESMIKAAGIVSIADIVSLADNWNSYTIDGSSEFYSANSLSPYENQDAVIFVDGLKTDIKIFDIQNLNTLPLSIEQIDYVEFISVPCIYLGNFITAGAIHIHTKTPGEGLSVQAIHTIGDETGDPGPLVFTEYKSPNVDKLAQFFAAGINAAGKDWFLGGHLKHEETFETDPAINKRLLYLNSDDNKAKILSYWFRTGIHALNGIQQLSVALTTNNDYLFFNPFGNEIPVKQSYRQFGFKGNAEFDNFGFNYSASTSLNEPGYLDNNKDVYFDFALNAFSLNIEGYYQSEFARIALGIGNDKYTASTTSVLRDKNISLRSLYLQADIIPDDNVMQSAGIFTTRNYNNYSIKGYLNNLWKINRYNSVFAGFSYIESQFAEDNNYWVWRNRGYKFNMSEDDYDVPDNFNSKKIFTADLNYTFKPDSGKLFRTGINFRRFTDYYLEKQLFQYNADTSTFSSLIEIRPEEYLKAYGAFASINYKITGSFTAGLYYSFTSYIEGSTLFEEAWQNFPRHHIALSLNYQLTEALGLFARIKYYSPTRWHDYKYASYQSDEKYITDIKPGLLVDLSANTWLWNKKIWLSAIAKNLFNEPEKYHAAGADLDLRVYIQLHFYFNSFVR